MFNDEILKAIERELKEKNVPDRKEEKFNPVTGEYEEKERKKSEK